jgi:hypothetical protein
MRDLIGEFESARSSASFGPAGFLIGENCRGILKKAVWGEECPYHSGPIRGLRTQSGRLPYRITVYCLQIYRLVLKTEVMKDSTF